MTIGGFLRGAAKTLQVLAVLLAVVGVAYRATLYWKIPVVPGEPYGMGDLLDFLFVVILTVVAGSCVVFGLVFLLPHKHKNRRLAYRVILVGIGSYAGYYFLHGAVPRLL